MYFCTTRNLGYETAHAIVTGGNRGGGHNCTFLKISGYQNYCSTHQHKNFKKNFFRKLILLNQNQKNSDDYSDLPKNHAADFIKF